MSEKIEIMTVSGVEGTCLYIDHYRISGPKPWGGGKPKDKFFVDKKELLDKILKYNSFKLTKNDFIKVEGISEYNYINKCDNININIYKLNKNKWVLEVDADSTFISKVFKSFSTCIDNIPNLVGYIK